jgi:hypothetical protein
MLGLTMIQPQWLILPDRALQQSPSRSRLAARRGVYDCDWCQNVSPSGRGWKKRKISSTNTSCTSVNLSLPLNLTPRREIPCRNAHRENRCRRRAVIPWHREKRKGPRCSRSRKRSPSVYYVNRKEPPDAESHKYNMCVQPHQNFFENIGMKPPRRSHTSIVS